MTWFVFALLSATSLAVAELIQQHLLNKKDAFTERASAVLTFFPQAIYTMPFLFFSVNRKEVFDVFQSNIFPNLIAVTVISSAGMVFYLRSFKVKSISISNIFGSLSVLVSTFLGIVFFSESISMFKFIGILLVLSAIIALNYKNLELEKNHFYGILSGILFGVAYTLDKSIVLQINPIIYMFWSFLFISIFGFFTNPKDIIISIKGKSLLAFRPILFSSIFYFLFNFFTFTAYSIGGEVGRIDAINNAQIFLIIIFEYFILKHETLVWRKILTAVLAYTGVVILGIV